VVEDELTTILEQVEETRLAVAPVEDVVLTDPYPGQASPVGGQGVVLAGESLLLLAKLLERGLPLGLGNDSGKLHSLPPTPWCTSRSPERAYRE